MTRPGGGWVPDGRAKAIAADCEASLAALDGLPIDLYLLHAPDPRTPWRTSLRALARLVDEGLVRRVGVANVNRAQLDEAVELAPIAAVQVALSPFDDARAARRARRALRRARHRADRALAARRAEAARARSRAASRSRARRAARRDRGRGRARVAARLSPERRRDPGRAASRDGAVGRAGGRAALDAAERRLDRAFGGADPARRARRRAGEVVLVMGIPGAGKSRLAAGYVERGLRRGSTATSAAARCASWPTRSTTQLAAGAAARSCSTTRT